MPDGTDAGLPRRWPSFCARAVLATLILHSAAGPYISRAAQSEPDDGVNRASWVSGNGLYRLSYSSNLRPIQINRLHSWNIHLETMDGQGVERAEFNVTGGMPIHDHGLPTKPRVTREIGNGDYLLEGVRFHMRGDWELVISVNSAAGSDTVVVELTI